MTTSAAGFLASAKTRQKGIFALLVFLLLLNAMTSVNERALFLPNGVDATAFAAIPDAPSVAALTSLTLSDLPVRPFLATPRLVGIANPPTNLVPPAAPGADGIAGPAEPGVPARSTAQSNDFTPAALNAPGNLGPNSTFNPTSPGGFFPGGATPGAATPIDPAATGNTDVPISIAPLPEPAGWLMMTLGFFVMGAALRLGGRARFRRSGSALLAG